MTTIKVQVVYEGNDGGDYTEVRILIDDVLHIKYGDHYDDKGRDKAEGFLDGYLALSEEEVQIEEEDLIIHDEDYPEDCECDECMCDTGESDS